jgi:hypothetical protein
MPIAVPSLRVRAGSARSLLTATVAAAALAAPPSSTAPLVSTASIAAAAVSVCLVAATTALKTLLPAASITTVIVAGGPPALVVMAIVGRFFPLRLLLARLAPVARLDPGRRRGLGRWLGLRRNVHAQVARNLAPVRRGGRFTRRAGLVALGRLRRGGRNLWRRLWLGAGFHAQHVGQRRPGIVRYRF